MIQNHPTLRVLQTWYPTQKKWSEAEIELPQFITGVDAPYWLSLFPHAAAISLDFLNFWEDPKQWLINYQHRFSLHPPMTGLKTSYGLEMNGKSRQITVDLQTDSGWMFTCGDQRINRLTLKAIELPPIQIAEGETEADIGEPTR
ncbi:hypothetical protein [Leptolyngbya sp. AN10]|uniref:hypothetical protein n=1 Tax=Leptolyngbya sp. AN10 TaxID=3423365 RepID=UPI003D32440C